METIFFQNRQFDFQIKFSKRKTFGIKVSGDGSILARSPMGYASSDVIEFMSQNAQWIIKQLDHLENTKDTKTYTNEYAHNELHRYLGVSYPLKISHGKRRAVTLFRNCLYVKSPNPEDSADVKKALHNFYKAQANSVFSKLIDQCWKLFTDYNLETPIYKYRFLKRKWGTCRMDGLITLNLELIKEDFKCIEYVIIHEMCHLIEANHSKHFYALMDQLLPDHRHTENILDLIII